MRSDSFCSEHHMQDKGSLRFKEEDESEPTTGRPAPEEKQPPGTSALFGRIDANVTYHPRGAYSETKFDNAFPGAYYQILKSALRMAFMFFRKK